MSSSGSRQGLVVTGEGKWLQVKVSGSRKVVAGGGK